MKFNIFKRKYKNDKKNNWNSLKIFKNRMKFFEILEIIDFQRSRLSSWFTLSGKKRREKRRAEKRREEKRADGDLDRWQSRISIFSHEFQGMS